jgi:hypothetical protein
MQGFLETSRVLDPAKKQVLPHALVSTTQLHRVFYKTYAVSLSKKKEELQVTS